LYYDWSLELPGLRLLRRPGRLAEAVAAAAAPAPTEVPREERPLLALVQQRRATVATDQLACVERFGELFVDGDRHRIHVDDLRPRPDARQPRADGPSNRRRPLATVTDARGRMRARK